MFGKQIRYKVFSNYKKGVLSRNVFYPIEYNEHLADGTAMTSKFSLSIGLNRLIMKTDFKHHPILTFLFLYS